MVEIIYKELSYQIMGLVFNVFKDLSYGYREKIYQRALASEFLKAKIEYKMERPVRIIYNNRFIGKYFLDFVVENKIVLELKIANDFYVRDIKQVFSYLKATDLRLGILIIINKNGVKFKRIVN